MLKSWTVERKRYSENENFSEKMLQKKRDKKVVEKRRH